MMPRRIASASAAVRSCTLNFWKMLLMCALAVSPLMPSAAAISLFRFPVASSSQHLELAQRQRRLAGARVERRLDFRRNARRPACTSRITRIRSSGTVSFSM